MREKVVAGDGHDGDEDGEVEARGRRRGTKRGHFFLCTSPMLFPTQQADGRHTAKNDPSNGAIGPRATQRSRWHVRKGRAPDEHGLFQR